MFKTFVIIYIFIPNKYSISHLTWGFVLVWEVGILVTDVADVCACVGTCVHLCAEVSSWQRVSLLVFFDLSQPYSWRQGLLVESIAILD